MSSSNVDYDQLGQSLRRVEHDSVGIPKQELEQKKGLVKQLVNDTLLPQLRACVKDLFYAGSAYEHLQAGEANDFDVQLFVDLSETKACDWKIVNYENTGKWKIVKYIGPAKPNISKYLVNDCLSAVALRQKFESLIDRVLESRSRNGIQVRRSTKGPAITLTVKAQGVKEFTIDLVIAVRGIDIGRNDRDFVAKPYNKKEPLSTGYENIWRSSFSQIEKKTFDGLDRGNLVHKKVLRILKLAFRHNAQMAMFPNYVLKNVMFAANEKYPQEHQWTDNQLPYRFYDVLRVYRDMLAGGNVPVHFEREIPTNLLQDYSKESVQQVVNHLNQRVLDRGTNGIIGLLAPLIAAEPQYNRPAQVPRTTGG